MPAHLYGAGVPARVLNTRPTRPGGGQVPGTPKDRVVYGVDVLPPCASLVPGLAEQPQESREIPAAVFIETPRIRAHGANKARPQRNGAGCPMEWPPGFKHQVLYPSGQTPVRSLADGGSAATPNGSLVRAENVLKHDQLPRSRPCLGGFNLARVALRPDQCQRVSGNATLTLIPTQAVRSGPATVPRPVPKCGRFPGTATGGKSLAART